MQPQIKFPKIEEITTYLKDYGWAYKETTDQQNQKLIVTNYKLRNHDGGILLSLGISGQFVMVSTVNFLRDIPSNYASRLLQINDTLKLVKIFNLNSPDSDTLHIELGFELWNESWTKTTFFSFLDMLCLGIEKTLQIIKEENIPHQTKFVTYGK